ncbi:MAG: response regulator [Treponema sp.]|nr:response regulator [Treponema sp.]
MDDNKKRILIMEDSLVFSDMLQNALTAEDRIIRREANGFDGLKAVYTFKPHLLISDIQMPLFKGYQVVRFLKSRGNTKEIPAILLSALSGSRDRFWGDSSGADRYLEKIADFGPLTETVAELLRGSGDIDFSGIEREGRKITDGYLIELVSNMLDAKLFQSTVIGMLAELSGRTGDLREVVRGFFDLLRVSCGADIAVLSIMGTRNARYCYSANFSGLSAEVAGDFLEVCGADFKKRFPDFPMSGENPVEFLGNGDKNEKISSYATFPLNSGDRTFASCHIGSCVNEYFSSQIMENLSSFLNAASPVLGNALSMLELAELERDTRSAFARYVPPEVMDDIISDSSKSLRQGETRDVTILFSDIRGFTDISEHSRADEVVGFLNSYFAELGTQVIAEGGYIDKFIGDEIMAVFGVTGDSGRHMLHAVRSAVRMLAAVRNVDISKVALPRGYLELGIGINSGPCILGNIGFKNKMDYTVIGDTVNLASRTERVTRLFNHPLVVSEYVYDGLRNHFLFRKIDNVKLRGKEKPVGVYAVHTGFRGQGTFRPRSGEIPDLPEVPELLVDRDTYTNYEKGLRLFFIEEWRAAGEYFGKALEADPGDFLSQLYLRRSIEFSQKPPPENWADRPVLDIGPSSEG